MDIDPYFQKALEILSDTVQTELGTKDMVSRELRRAVTTLKPVDIFTARLAFDAMPGYRRRRIKRKAEKSAIVYRNRVRRTEAKPLTGTERDWTDLPLPRRRPEPEQPPIRTRRSSAKRSSENGSLIYYPDQFHQDAPNKRR